MTNIFKFNIDFDKDFHIIFELPQQDIPEPINEEYSVIELENNFREEIDNIFIDETIQNNVSFNNINNVNLTINNQINSGEELLQLFQNNLENIINPNYISQQIDEEINKKKTLNKSQIDLIISEKYGEKKRNENVCSICYSAYQETDSIRILKCNHFFHKDCLDNWLLNYNNNCPFCKIDLI